MANAVATTRKLSNGRAVQRLANAAITTKCTAASATKVQARNSQVAGAPAARHGDAAMVHQVGQQVEFARRELKLRSGQPGPARLHIHAQEASMIRLGTGKPFDPAALERGGRAVSDTLKQMITAERQLLFTHRGFKLDDRADLESRIKALLA